MIGETLKVDLGQEEEKHSGQNFFKMLWMLHVFKNEKIDLND